MNFYFDNFRVDPRSNSLYFEERLVEGLSKKSVQILSVLLESPKQVVSHDEIISKVWGENYKGATPQSVAQYIRKLRKILSAIRPDENFISTAPNRGYGFDRDVTVAPGPNGSSEDDKKSRPKGSHAPTFENDARHQIVQEADENLALPTPVWSRRWVVVPVAAMVFIAVVYAGSSYFSVAEEEKVRQVVMDSQLYESLVLYRDPKSFSEENLDKYWTTEIGVNSNFDRKRIREGVRSLVEKAQYYGSETKCEQFEFQSVEIDAKNDMALVKTLEKWFIAVYRENGELEKNKYVGPYFVSYVLRNTGGEWLVEKSSTARANLVTPRLTGIEPVTRIEAGKQIFVKLTGQDFLPQSVYISITGEGCPEANPCVVPNKAILKHSKISDTSIDNAPLTLSSGEFLIRVHSSENHVSNPLSLTVP